MKHLFKIIFGILGLISFLLIISLSMDIEVGKKQVNCYDRLYNEIEGLVCWGEITEGDKLAGIMASCFFGFIIFIIVISSGFLCDEVLK